MGIKKITITIINPNYVLILCDFYFKYFFTKLG
jgi:hypothetical protein